MTIKLENLARVNELYGEYINLLSQLPCSAKPVASVKFYDKFGYNITDNKTVLEAARIVCAGVLRDVMHSRLGVLLSEMEKLGADVDDARSQLEIMRCSGDDR